MAKIQGVHVPFKFKNYIINGNYDFWQRIESGSLSINSASAGPNYSADRFSTFVGGTTTKVLTIAQSSNVPTLAQSGFESAFSYLATCTTGIASYSASDLVIPIRYVVEGYDYQRIHSKTVTFGFWAYASLAGTYNFSMKNNAANRAYVTTFSITTPSTWQYITLTVTLDSAGTWTFNNTLGLEIDIGNCGGSNFVTSTLGSWQAGNFYTASTAGNWFGTSGATLSIAQFSLVEGETAMGQIGFQRAGDTISEELRMCQRYYEKSYELGTVPGASGATGACVRFTSRGTDVADRFAIPFKVQKRADPTSTVYSPNSGTSSKIYDFSATADLAASVGISGMYNVDFFPTANSTSGHIYGIHFASDCDL